MRTSSKRVKLPPVEPTLEPNVTVGDYLDGKAFYEDILEVIALHIIRSVLRGRKAEKPQRYCWWLLPRRQDG